MPIIKALHWGIYFATIILTAAGIKFCNSSKRDFFVRYRRFAIFMVVVFALLITYFENIYEIAIYDKMGVVTEAEVLYKGETFGRHTEYRVTYEYTDAAKVKQTSYDTIAKSRWEKINPGDKINIKYLSSSPSDSRMMPINHSKLYIVPMVLAIIAVFFWLLDWLKIYKEKRKMVKD